MTDRLIDGVIRDQGRLDEEIAQFWESRDREEKRAAAGVAISALGLFWLSILIGILSSGCALSQMDRFRLALSATASTVTAGYRAVDAYDQDQHDRLAQLASNNMDEAMKEYQSYTAKRNAVLKALDTAADAVHAGDLSLGAVDAIKRKDWGDLTTKIIAAGFVVSDALQTFGVHIPGVTQ